MVGGLDSRGGVLVDEMGDHTSLAPLYGYLSRGQRVFFRSQEPEARTHYTPFVRMSSEGTGPSMAVEGSTVKEAFEAYMSITLFVGSWY